MPNHRTPQAKAEVSGANIIHPERFKDRKTPKRTRPLGDPYLRMTEAQKEAWAEFAAEMPWLHSAHRQLVRLACILAAKVEEGSDGVSAMQAMSSILSKLGATPVDETKVNHDGDDEDDSAGKFFGARPN